MQGPFCVGGRTLTLGPELKAQIAPGYPLTPLFWNVVPWEWSGGIVSSQGSWFRGDGSLQRMSPSAEGGCITCSFACTIHTCTAATACAWPYTLATPAPDLDGDAVVDTIQL